MQLCARDASGSRPADGHLRGNRAALARLQSALAAGCLLPVTLLVSGVSWAEPGLRIGARGGIALEDGVDPYVGADLRLSFSRSPLTINPTFDYVFDEKMTLYRLSVNALYYLPFSIGRVDPYVGIGVNVTSFSVKEKTPPVANGGQPGGDETGDDNGNRLGMNLAAGACFDLPVISPFVEIVKGVGEFDPLSLGGGLLFALDGDERWNGCGRRVP